MTTADLQGVEEDEEVWFALLFMLFLVIAMLCIIFCLTIYIRNQKQQRLNSQEINSNSAGADWSDPYGATGISSKKFESPVSNTAGGP